MTNRLTSFVTVLLLLTAALAPMTVAASASGNTDDDVAVETNEAGNVTNASTTLHGNLTELPKSESATVYFEYWAEGDAGNTMTTDSGVAEEPNTFRTTVDGLENGTTYVYVAYAETNDTVVSGDEVTFTAVGSDDNETTDENVTDGFGQNVSSFVHNLLENHNETNKSVGMLVSEFVTENNPGAEKRSNHASPPEDKGKEKSKNDKRQGASEDRGNDNDDKRQGPPEDRGNNDDDNSEDNKEDGNNTKESGGPP